MRIFALWAIALTALVLTVSQTCFADINHLELGAANYSPLAGADPAKRYAFLINVVQDLVARDGKKGKIYLNDINGPGLHVAVEFLKTWLIRQKLPDIEVVELPGNYNEIALPEILHSVHLANPGTDQFPHWNRTLVDARMPDSNPKKNKTLIRGLERLADRSETGLMITSYFHKGDMSMQAMQTYVRTGWELEDTGEEGHQYNEGNGKPKDLYSNPEKPTRTRVYYFRKKIGLGQCILRGLINH